MNVFSSIRKLGKVLTVLACITISFYVYNSIIVDHSLISLKVALAQAAEAKTVEDLEKIKLLIKPPLFKDVSSKEASSRELIALELASNVVATQDPGKAKEAVFYLKEAIKIKEAERPAIFSLLDRVNILFFRPSLEAPDKNIKAKIKSLLINIESAKDKGTLQNLYYELANYYIQLEDYQRAEEALVKSADIEPYSKIAIKARFNIGWIYKMAGRKREAVDYFNKMSRELADTDRDLSVVCLYQVADTLYKMGDFKGARDLYAQLVNDSSQFGSTDFGLLEAGNISLYNLGDARAASAFLEALSLYRKRQDYSALVSEAIEYIKGGQDSSAGKESSILEKEDLLFKKKAPLEDIPLDRAKGHRAKGFQMLKDGKYGQAKEEFELALDILPKDALSLSGLSLSYYWLKQDDKALVSSRKSLEFSPLDELVVANAIFIFINNRLLDEAIRAGERLLAQRKTISRPEVYYNVGYAYIMKEKIDEAVTYFRNAVRLDQQFNQALNNLAVVLWSQRKFDEGVRLLLDVVARNPGYADAQYNLGAIYLNMRRMEEAYHQFELVLDIDPDYKDVKRYMDFIVNYLKKR